MSISDRVLRLADRLIRHAVRPLPESDRAERYREWIAEVPAILADPDVRPALRRAFRALLYAADQHRSVFFMCIPQIRGRIGASGSSPVFVAALAAAAAVVAFAAPGRLGSAALVAATVCVSCTYILIIIWSARRRAQAAREQPDVSEANPW